MRARVLVIATLVVLLALPLVVEKELATRAPSGASPFNVGPEGTSSLVEAFSEHGFNVTIARSWSRDFGKLKPCLILIVSPEMPYSSTELEVIRELVNSGANILIADEGTHSNRVLEYLGIPVRVSGKTLFVGGREVFLVATRVGDTELKVVYAYSSSIDLVETVDRAMEVIAEVNGSILAVAYRTGNYSAVVVGDGTILTNALLNPRNVLNHNYVFAYYTARLLCPEGTILIEGSKYELRPRLPAGREAPLTAYLNPLSRVLSVVLLVLTAAYVVLPRLKIIPRSERAAAVKALGSYEVARILCRDRELSDLLSRECASFAKTHRAQQLIEHVTVLVKKDKELATRVLRAIIEKGGSAGEICT